jgi:hypothetical protein
VSIQSGLGEISLNWRTDIDGHLGAELTIPFGATAILNFPVTGDSMILCDGVEMVNGETLEHGSYKIFVGNVHVSTSKSESAKS